MSSFSSMNGINQTRNALANNKKRMGMAGTEQAAPPGAGMMGTSPQPYALSQYGGFVNKPQQPQMAQAQGSSTMASPTGNYGMSRFVQDDAGGSKAGMQGPQFQAPSAPQFDPNDPRNAALAGYMNGR